MTALAGPYLAAALLVIAAGTLKLARPAPATRAMRAAGLPARPWLTRVVGAAEVAVGLAALPGGRAGALALALSYAAFAAFAARALGRAGTCGCFGELAAPVGPVHVAVNCALAATAAVVAGAPLPAAFLAAQPGRGLPLVLVAVATAFLLSLTLTGFAELRRVLAR